MNLNTRDEVIVIEDEHRRVDALKFSYKLRYESLNGHGAEDVPIWLMGWCGPFLEFGIYGLYPRSL